MNQTAVEYAIEVPGRGYIDAFTGQVARDPDSMSCIESRKQALDSLQSTAHKYVNMGCPEIAETLRIAQRTITVTRSDWEPIE